MTSARLRRFEMTDPALAQVHKRRIGTMNHLRLTVSDRPGILAHVAQIISKAGMNIDAVLQQPNMSKDDLSFVITVEPTPEPEIRKVVKEINKLDFLLQPVLLLRIASE